MCGRVFARGTLVLLVVCRLFAPPQAAAAPAAAGDGIAHLLTRVESALLSGDPDRYLQLLAPGADRHAAATLAASVMAGPPIHAAVREQDRTPLDSDTCRLIVTIFTDGGFQGALATWRVDVRRSAAQPETWQVADQQSLTSLGGLFAITMNTAKVYAARGVSIEAEDFTLLMSDGSAFVLEAAGRMSGLVLVGKGDVTFRPSPASERGQMRIFAGAPEMQTAIDGAFVRFNPSDVARVRGLDHPQSGRRDVRRAAEVFRQYNARSYTLDLADLSTGTWSLLPAEGDVLVEMFTRRFGALTYTRAHDEPEDVALFDRKSRRNIATYASRARLAARGPFYDEDAQADYDVINYDVDARILPESGTIVARARMTFEVRADSLTHLNVRLADALRVHSVVAEDLGRLLALRVPGRNTVIVSLPAIAVRGTRLTLRFDYSGSVTSSTVDAEAVAADGGAGPQDPQDREETAIEDSYVYSNRSYWYPQSPTADYATATLRLGVPARYGVVATGERQTPAEARAGNLQRFVFRASKPVRYLACVITPLVEVKSERLKLTSIDRGAVTPAAKPTSPAPPAQPVQLTVRANPREKSQGRALAALAADIVRFYAGIMGDYPYPSLDLALVERELPGGHSPGYVAIINYPVSASRLSWHNDPATIEDFREYFVAHEIAHQWWGQAVGWKNYHEQWLSEGFAQYFSALYAEHAHGPGLFQDILRRWQQWTVEKSEQGPVYLGYRVGHIKGDPRVFRAVVYNKSALVLHMLRRFVGDEPFFAGLRRFYRDFRFRKAGTDDLQRSIEAEAGVPLQRFFDRWIYSDSLPRVRAVARVEEVDGRSELIVKVGQSGEVFDAPVVVTLDYADRRPADVTIKLEEAEQEFRIPLAASLRRLELNHVDAVPFTDLVVTLASPGASSRAKPRPPRGR